MTLRTPDEIAARIREVENDDWMGTQRTDLIAALPFEDARPYLRDDVVPEQWATVDEAAVRKTATGYLTFAVGKALDHRGLSAERSIDHFTSWLWLLGVLPAGWEETGYAQYGAPKLAAAAQALGVDPETVPGMTDEDFLRMAAGEPCEPGCTEGCGQ